MPLKRHSLNRIARGRESSRASFFRDQGVKKTGPEKKHSQITVSLILMAEHQQDHYNKNIEKTGDYIQRGFTNWI